MKQEAKVITVKLLKQLTLGEIVPSRDRHTYQHVEAEDNLAVPIVWVLEVELRPLG